MNSPSLRSHQDNQPITNCRCHLAPVLIWPNDSVCSYSPGPAGIPLFLGISPWIASAFQIPEQINFNLSVVTACPPGCPLSPNLFGMLRESWAFSGMLRQSWISLGCSGNPELFLGCSVNPEPFLGCSGHPELLWDTWAILDLSGMLRAS